MGLETASFISQLIASNPLPSDPRSEGDDHLRLIKSVLKTSFPNVNAAVNASSAELNSLVGITGNLVSQLNTKVEQQQLSGYASLSQPQSFTRGQRFTPTALGPVSGSLLLDLSLSNIFSMTISNVVNSVGIVNGSAGQPLWIYIENAGGLPITLGSSWISGGGVVPNLSLPGNHLLHALFFNGSPHIIHAALQMS